jgi:spermidine synthase
VLRDSAAAFDLIALDTDNGPAWLVRDDNAALYEPRGLELVRRALRPGGVAVFWSPEHYPWFARRLEAPFVRVIPSEAHDQVQGRRLAYTMYACLV